MKKLSIIIFILITVAAVFGYASRIDFGGDISPGVTSDYGGVSPKSIIGSKTIQSKEPVSKVLVVLISGFLVLSLIASIRRSKKWQKTNQSKPNIQPFNTQIKHPS